MNKNSRRKTKNKMFKKKWRDSNIKKGIEFDVKIISRF
jgi:hypothetical protein